MAYRVVFTPEATAQLLSIYSYIANHAAADRALRFTDAIVAHCENLATFPRRGTLRSDLRPGLRIIGFQKRVTIAFAVLGNAVTIVGIFYGGQDVEAVLEGKDDGTT